MANFKETKPLKMKHYGATMEYSKERMNDLMRTYDNYISSCSHISMPEVYKNVVKSPSQRFWVSDIRATKVIYSMINGDRLEYMRPLKREMFREIHRRVTILKEEHKDWSISKCCSIVVTQQAPQFYLTAGSAKVMICKARKEWIRTKMKRAQRLCL